MSDTEYDTSTIVESMRDPIHRYTGRVVELAGQNALALILFDSIAAGTFDPRRHVARSIVVLKTMDLPLLRTLAKDGQKWGKARIAAPLIMTPEYVQSSLDTFPLEFLEIHQCHVCIFGKDYFSDVSFADSHMRLQCERELKTILIGLRQGLLAAAGREKLFAPMEADATDRLMRTLRGLLWLHGQKESLPGHQVIKSIEQEIGNALPGIRTAIDTTTHHGWEEFCSLYKDVDALKDVINAW